MYLFHEWAEEKGTAPMLTTSRTPLFLGHNDSPEAWGTMMSSIPLGRLCQPDDVANAACFLASNEASFLTGVCLEVAGVEESSEPNTHVLESKAPSRILSILI